MRDEIIARAGFLLTELRLAPDAAQLRLKDWYPDLEREERVRFVQEATLRDPGDCAPIAWSVAGRAAPGGPGRQM